MSGFDPRAARGLAREARKELEESVVFAARPEPPEGGDEMLRDTEYHLRRSGGLGLRLCEALDSALSELAAARRESQNLGDLNDTAWRHIRPLHEKVAGLKRELAAAREEAKRMWEALEDARGLLVQAAGSSGIDDFEGGIRAIDAVLAPGEDPENSDSLED